MDPSLGPGNGWKIWITAKMVSNLINTIAVVIIITIVVFLGKCNALFATAVVADYRCGFGFWLQSKATTWKCIECIKRRNMFFPLFLSISSYLIIMFVLLWCKRPFWYSILSTVHHIVNTCINWPPLVAINFVGMGNSYSEHRHRRTHPMHVQYYEEKRNEAKTSMHYGYIIIVVSVFKTQFTCYIDRLSKKNNGNRCFISRGKRTPRTFKILNETEWK